MCKCVYMYQIDLVILQFLRATKASHIPFLQYTRATSLLFTHQFTLLPLHKHFLSVTEKIWNVQLGLDCHLGNSQTIYGFLSCDLSDYLKIKFLRNFDVLKKVTVIGKPSNFCGNKFKESFKILFKLRSDESNPSSFSSGTMNSSPWPTLEIEWNRKWSSSRVGSSLPMFGLPPSDLNQPR